MTFDETLGQVLGLLRREKRVSYRALKRRFNLDDDYIDDLKDEIIEAKQLAVDENKKVLVWINRLDSSAESESAKTAPVPALTRPQPHHSAALNPAAEHIPGNVRTKILSARHALEGRRHSVSVLACEISAAEISAAEISDAPVSSQQHIEQALNYAVAAINRYQGFISQPLDHGFIALFGAPLVQQEHAYQAVRAALAMQETIAGYLLSNELEINTNLQLRIGINSGFINIARISSDLRMNYSAVGNTIHLATRLQTLADSGMTLISENTEALLQNFICSEPIGPVQVKGQWTPVAVHKVIGRRNNLYRWLPLSQGQRARRLVGRQTELTCLNDHLKQVLSGSSQIINISSGFGFGASRLLAEFQSGLPASVYWIGECCPATATPYGLWRNTLIRLLAIEGDDSSLQIKHKLHQALNRIDTELMNIAVYLEELLGLPGSPLLAQLPSHEKRLMTFNALRSLLTAICRQQPVVLVVDELQRIDNSSLECLSGLMVELQASPILFIMLRPDDYSVPWSAQSHCIEINLQALNAEQCETMAADWLATTQLPQPLSAWLYENTQGNPLVIEECLQTLLDKQLLQQQNRSWCWQNPESNSREKISFAFVDMIKTRCQALPESACLLVQLLAVIGYEAELSLLQHIYNDAAELEKNIEILSNVALIQKQDFATLPILHFRHGLIRESIYQNLSAARRRALHETVGHALEQCYSDQLTAQSLRLTQHYLASARQDKAATYALLAGDQAHHYGALADAKQFYQQALNIAQTLPNSADAQQLQIDADIKLAALSTNHNDNEHQRHNLEYARILAADLQDKLRLSQVMYWLGRLCYQDGDIENASVYAERSLAIADQLGDETLTAAPFYLTGQIAWLSAEYEKAGDLLVNSADQLQTLGNSVEQTGALAYASWVFACLGQFDKALNYSEQSLQLAQKLPSPATQSIAHLCCGAVNDQRGDWNKALAAYGKAEQLTRNSDDPARWYLIQCLKGRAYQMNGDLERAVEILESSLKLAEQLDTSLVPAWPRVYLANGLLRLQRYDKAQRLCQQAIQLAKKANDQYGLFSAQRTLAEILTRLNKTPSIAENTMRDAISLQQHLGAQPELARSYVSYAEMLQRWGKYHDAREYFQLAQELFEQLQMDWDLTELNQQFSWDQRVS